MVDIENKLKKIHSSLNSSNISLLSLVDLNSEVFSFFSNRNLPTKTVQLLSLTWEKGISIFFRLIKKWQEGKIKVSGEELKKIEEFNNNVLKVFLKKIKKSITEDHRIDINKKEKEKFKKHFESIVKQEQELSVLIEKEKNRSLPQSKPTTNSSPNKPDPFKEKQNYLNDIQVDQQLIEPSANDYEKLEEVIQKIDSLQVELKNIEQNLIDLHPHDQENIQAIEKLRNEFIKFQEQLQEESKQIKVSEQKISFPSKSRDEFNWLYVVIPGGALILIMGIIIAYLAGKKPNKQK